MARKIKLNNQTARAVWSYDHTALFIGHSFSIDASIWNKAKDPFMRYISCAYCGRMHPSGVVCEKKPKRREKRVDTAAVHIRNSSRWQRTREYIKHRDNNLCQLCLRGYPGTKRRVEYEHLSVHHIVSLEDDKTKAFDHNNLITLCDIHHEAAESGLVSKADLMRIVNELENGEPAPSLGEYTPGA